MRLSCVFHILVLALLTCGFSSAQVVHQVTATAPTSGSYVVFKFDWDQGRPWVKYTISADDAGNAHFEGIGNPQESGDSDSFTQSFKLTDACRQKLFELAQKTDYFQAIQGPKQKNIAKTGEKVLEYHKGDGGNGSPPVTSSAYNYSPNVDVQELTRIFQAIALTMDYGRKLAFDYRFNKLGIDARLHSLQDMQASHFVEELQAIEPILQKIANDPNMMHINQVTARQLLKSIGPMVPLTPAASQP
jgi:hypothetical protein